MANCLDFTDLVLLIGKNPLANYVAAEYFIEKNENLETVRLVYSQGKDNREGTYAYAKNLCDVLEVKTSKRGREIKFCVIGLEDISTAEKIRRNILNHIKENKLDTKKLHLNYTGGTKAMAVHVYNTLKDKFSHGFSASYLDARDFKMKFDFENDTRSEQKDLRKTVTVEWEDLFKMHNYEYKKSSKKINAKGTFLDKLTDDEYEQIMQNISKLATKGKLQEIKDFIDTVNKGKLFFKPQKKDSNYKESIEKGLGNFSATTNKELFCFLQGLPEDVRLVDKHGNWIHDNFSIPANQDSGRFGSFKKFLEGFWLEGYVCWVIRNNDPLLGLVSNKEWVPVGNKKTKEFEIDVLIKNGYQLCGISCGTSRNETNLKQKGFEVILRTRQLGGDEALAVLATLISKEKIDNKSQRNRKNKLEEDLKSATGTRENNFIVLGIEDLHPDTLWDEIRKHIYGR